MIDELKMNGKLLGVFFVLISLVFMGTVLYAADGKIVGHVRDSQSGEPLPAANVFIKGTNFGAATDLEGRFVISKVPVGNYEMTVQYIGYQAETADISVKVGETSEIEIALSFQSVEGEIVVVTAQAEEGEQILHRLEDVCSLPVPSGQRTPEARDLGCAQPEVVLRKGDEVISLFLAGEADNGFLSFAQYLGYWLEAKDAIMVEHPGMEERLSELFKECLGAMQSKDVVTLMDAIEYGFKPFLERSLIPSRHIRIWGSNSQGFSEQGLPS